MVAGGSNPAAPTSKINNLGRKPNRPKPPESPPDRHQKKSRPVAGAATFQNQKSVDLNQPVAIAAPPRSKPGTAWLCKCAAFTVCSRFLFAPTRWCGGRCGSLQNLIFERYPFWIILNEPSLSGFLAGKHFQVINVAGQGVSIDANPYGYSSDHLVFLGCFLAGRGGSNVDRLG